MALPYAILPKTQGREETMETYTLIVGTFLLILGFVSAYAFAQSQKEKANLKDRLEITIFIISIAICFFVEDSEWVMSLFVVLCGLFGVCAGGIAKKTS